ncbi:MAG: ABC transporter ATP-binding protein, partial [bacterium]|nr:ABC transporter ATP-binding protein [bacterium]
MSSEIAIKVESLGKCYQIYEQPHDRLKQMILPRLYRLAGKTGKSYFREFWALRDVSFSVNKGKVAGIIGKNGAGKSTLLQILCGTVMATSGKIHVKGRIAALLELGAGFNPDFTGIENVRMNGQILGLSHVEIDRKLPDIAAFADIGDFIRQPVKTYSSGMFARLAFAVAVHVDPDILVVDEALSVGDSWFQHKSMAKMRSLMQRGCTVLFVSHSIDAVRALCDEVIWIENGSVKMQGSVTEISNLYMNEVFIEHNRIVIQNIQQLRNTDLESSLNEIGDNEPNEPN